MEGLAAGAALVLCTLLALAYGGTRAAARRIRVARRKTGSDRRIPGQRR